MLQVWSEISLRLVELRVTLRVSAAGVGAVVEAVVGAVVEAGSVVGLEEVPLSRVRGLLRLRGWRFGVTVGIQILING